jgi:hypothetical protein
MLATEPGRIEDGEVCSVHEKETIVTDRTEHPATPDEVYGIVGRIDDGRVAAIIKLGATVAEVTEAFARMGEDPGVEPALRRPFAGRVAEVHDLLTMDMPGPDEET